MSTNAYQNCAISSITHLFVDVVKKPYEVKYMDANERAFFMIRLELFQNISNVNCKLPKFKSFVNPYTSYK